MKIILIFIICFISLNIFADPPNWQEITGTQYSMVLFTTIIFNNSSFDNSGTNMAAAFGPGGIDDCREIAGWESGNPGFWYFNIVGNTNGEEISFKIYDEASDQIYDCDQTFIFQDGDTFGSPSDPYTLTSEFTLLLPPQNVNISFNSTREIIALSWSTSINANSYYIYADDTVDVVKSSENLVGHTSDTTWIDFDFEQYTRKFYVVTASSDTLILDEEVSRKNKTNDKTEVK
ncbi:MAG: hypothetical protein K9N09_06410 [Candidatus Cloacimonetes bacterium]|nr:hypothetical protein [Candidatus Cloacimonadota bacterium]MCF7813639.1 hypothetical protein [Candidatus Cloacimonadota bacterium]MCF7868318.1 hypothetical protein [Candidatus Cloacimonadota bacterium]MCF7883792.1 hypothetical protein [Candidatus Cloacimonadota bacterium]